MRAPFPAPQELGELLRLLAHDLRNPLSALDSNLSFLEGELAPFSDAANEALDDLKLSCDGVNRIVDSVEVLGRFLQGKMSEECIASPIGALLQAAADMARPAALSHGVELVMAQECLTSTSEVLVGRELFVKTLRLILHNAIQHAPQGSEVRVTLLQLPEDVVVQVQDQGGALDASMQEDAFTAAGQLRAKQVRGGRYSSGLGLFCARTCAQAAGAYLKGVPGEDCNVFQLSARRLLPNTK